MISDKGDCKRPAIPPFSDDICCAENCISGVIIMPGESKPGEVMGDMPMDPIDIIPFLERTPGEEKPCKNGFCMLLSLGNMAPIPFGPPTTLTFPFFPGFYSSKKKKVK